MFERYFFKHVLEFFSQNQAQTHLGSTYKERGEGHDD